MTVHAQARGADPGPSTWFFWARVARQGRWDPRRRLPLFYLAFHAGVSLVIALLIVVWWVRLLLGHFLMPAPSTLIAWSVIYAMSLAYVYGVLRRPPWGWYYASAMMLSGLLPALVQRDLVLVLVAAVHGALVILYMGRRRPQFGLPPWPAVL